MKYWLETLGCPKNQVDSDKLGGALTGEGHTSAEDPSEADLVVVNTCAFIEAARQESIDTILGLDDLRRAGSRLVVTGCLAERYGDELAAALPEVDQVAGFGVSFFSPSELPEASQAESPRRQDAAVPVRLSSKPAVLPSFDLLNLPRPAASAPWAYLKVAEGCNRSCGFCSIPSFRGKQRSRTQESLLAEVESLDVREVVLVAQDLASYGRDAGQRRAILPLIAAVAERVDRVRLLYLYPSELDEALIEAIGETECHYFDLSLQHVSRTHLRRMRRWGDGVRFEERLGQIRSRFPDAAFRSSFIIGYPGETEDDHDQLLGFLANNELDWAGFFPYSREEGTRAAAMDDQIDPALVADRLSECSELQQQITEQRRRALVGTTVKVLVDRTGVARSHREAPEIDGVITVPTDIAVGTMLDVRIVGARGVDLEAVAVATGSERSPLLVSS